MSHGSRVNDILKVKDIKKQDQHIQYRVGFLQQYCRSTFLHTTIPNWCQIKHLIYFVLKRYDLQYYFYKKSQHTV